MKQDIDSSVLLQALERFEQIAQDSCLNKPLTKELVYLANSAQSQLKKGHPWAADSNLATAMLTIKRNLGTEISLRTGFQLSDILIGEVRALIGHPGAVLQDSSDFAQTFFGIYSNNEFRDPGLPEYLMQRPFPTGFKSAAKTIIATLKTFELPKDQLAILEKDVRAIVNLAAKYKKNPKTRDILIQHDVLITSLYYDMLDMQGIYITQHQVLTVMGLVFFAAPPAWLCWSPPAIIVQIIILVLGAIGYGIYSAMQSAATKAAYKNMWAYISDCTKSVQQALAELNRQTAGLDANQKADLKKALKKTLKQLNKMTFTGQRGKVAAKLRALIQAL